MIKMKQKNILHVTECFAGGVSRALESRVDVTPELNHHLLYSGSDIPSDNFSTINRLEQSLARNSRLVQRLVHELKIDIIHAHSSWAGVITRLRKHNIPVVYEPHCFKFADPSLDKFTKFFYRNVERCLSYRTTKFGSLSVTENQQICSLNPKADIVEIPNVPYLDIKDRIDITNTPKKVVMIGRLCRQKDPEYFVQVCNELKVLNSSLSFEWIGDGDEKYKKLLIMNNIAVTGWLDKKRISSALHNAIYVHAASYEGFPLSILDAAAVGSPIVLRDIESVSDLSYPKGHDPSRLARIVRKIEMSSDYRHTIIEKRKELLQFYSKANLRSQLTKLYSND